jgi:dsDNA-specific endonuclease/ATPase MutS2
MQSGDFVHTPFGKGVVRETRNSGRVVVEVKGRTMEFDPGQVSRAEPSSAKARHRDRRASPRDPGPIDSPPRRGVPSEVDLHGLTVDEALARAELAVNDAILANLPELRLIHGRSGGRIRGALHRWLGSVRTVSGFRVDPRNAGVTIVQL